MGASNFHYENASKCYAVLMNYEQPVLDENGNETDQTEWHTPDAWEVDDFVQDLEMTIDHAFKGQVSNHVNQDPHELRSYPSRVITTIYDRKEVGMYSDLHIELTAVMRGGYHEGACLDHFARIFINGEENDLESIDCPEMERQAERMLNALTTKLEAIYETFSMPLKKVAAFSNGETIYEKA